MTPNGRAFPCYFLSLLTCLTIATAAPGHAVITFTDIAAGLPWISIGATEWGDYDRDGDLDLLLSGYTSQGPITRIYECNTDGFAETQDVLPAVCACSAAWGDYDNDGDLDIVLAGLVSAGNPLTRVFRNDGVLEFTDINADLYGIFSGAATWADYDNDGDLDILISGNDYANAPATRLYRNDGSGVFTLVEKGLVQLRGSAAAWGDYDTDGDLDLGLAGTRSGGGHTTYIYRNDGGDSAWPIVADLIGAGDGTVAWADFDCDGDLDLLVAGYDGTGGFGRSSRVYWNEGGGVFTDAAAGLLGLSNGDASWGDYDNDGDLDLLLSGLDPEWVQRTLLYVNDGAGGLEPADTPLLQLAEGTVKWGDYDRDGDLDIVESGDDQSDQPRAAVFRSDGALPNTLPSAPTSLSSAIQGDHLILDWSAASDAETPTVCLTYNLRIGTSAGGSEIMSAMSRGDGLPEIVALGNTQERTRWAIDVRSAQYYWTVQALDGVFAGSAFAAEQTISPAAAEDSEADMKTRIASIAPNPSAHVTGITVEVGAAAQARLTIYDVAGRRVRVLLNEFMKPGIYPVSWDGTDDQGLPMGAGCYLCRLDAGSITAARSILRIE